MALECSGSVSVLSALLDLAGFLEDGARTAALELRRRKLIPHAPVSHKEEPLSQQLHLCHSSSHLHAASPGLTPLTGGM